MNPNASSDKNKSNSQIAGARASQSMQPPVEYASASPIIPAGRGTLTSISPFASEQGMQPAQQMPVQQNRRVRQRRAGCLALGCRTLGCLVPLLVLGSLCFIAYLVIVRPPQLWEPVKRWLNDDLESIQIAPLTPATVFGQLNDQVGDFDIGDNDLQITEAQFKVLFDSGLKNVFPSEVYTDLRKDLLRIYWNIDASSSVPLWAVLEFGVNGQGQLELTKIGTQRVPLPEFLNQLLSNFALSAMQIGRQQQNSDLLGALVPLPQNVSLKKVRIDEDKMVITLTVNNGLDGLFQ